MRRQRGTEKDGFERRVLGLVTERRNDPNVEMTEYHTVCKFSSKFLGD